VVSNRRPPTMILSKSQRAALEYVRPFHDDNPAVTTAIDELLEGDEAIRVKTAHRRLWCDCQNKVVDEQGRCMLCGKSRPK
jgi:hypothetical protein